jgi:hypothetical protein
LLPNIGSITKVEGGSLYTFLYTETDFSSGQILMKFGLYPNFQIANRFPQVTADTSYSNSMTQETRSWSSPVNSHLGQVGSTSHAERPPITHWTNENDVLPSVYGGHDSVSSNKKQNIDNVGPPNAVSTEMDKDLTTRGQILVQKLEDTSWSDADDSPNAR